MIQYKSVIEHTAEVSARRRPDYINAGEKCLVGRKLCIRIFDNGHNNNNIIVIVSHYNWVARKNKHIRK